MINRWLLALIALVPSTGAQETPSGPPTLVDGVAVDLPVLRGNDSYSVVAAPAVAALTGGTAEFRVRQGFGEIVTEGQVMARIPLVDPRQPDPPDLRFQFFDPPGSAKPFRQAQFGETLRLEQVGGARVPVINLEILAAILGASVDFESNRTEIFTSRYWATQLGLPTDKARMNPLSLVPEFGVTPPATTMMVWVRPSKPAFVQIFRLSDGIPRPMLGLNPLSGDPETVDSGELPRIRAASPTTPVRVETEHFATRIGRFGRYAAFVTTKDLGGKNPIDAVLDGDVGPNDYAVVGLRQLVAPNPVRFRMITRQGTETLAQIAARTKNNLFLLRDLNGIRPGEPLAPKAKLIVVDQVVPLAPSASYRFVGAYAAKVGDTIEQLAQTWRVPVANIFEANPQLIEGQALAPGDLLQQIGPANVAPPRASAVPATGTATVKVDAQILSAPQAGAPAVGPIEEADTVSLEHRVDEGKFYRVSFGSVTGYLPGSVLNITKIELAPTTPPPASGIRVMADAPNPRGVAVIQEAVRYLGTPYRWGGNCLTGGIDCSHYVSAVFDKVGARCPPPPVFSQEQSPIVQYKEPAGRALQGTRVVRMPARPSELTDLRPGDRIIVQRGLAGEPGSRHTGIYAGKVNFRGRLFRHAVVHAARPGVRIDELTGGRLWKDYRFSVRDAARPRAR